ncbi:5297_t:CDS:2, partial [Gigaspora margarita]
NDKKNMTDLQTLQKYDNFKKAKKQRKTYIAKTTFASEDKIMEHVEKIDKIDDKLKKSIVKKPLS